ncbi:hypothetical protein L13192_04992 [Pyrenophora tritici-repentis]|nr:hypothetical protein L13192_04992 [Pyrenophora tritici-repentis]KAI1685479.1 hypothetical protein KJE20_05763 [Pyrenophora tritici-repentis]
MADESDVVIHTLECGRDHCAGLDRAEWTRRPPPTAYGPAHCHGISNGSLPLVFVNGAVATRDMD